MPGHLFAVSKKTRNITFFSFILFALNVIVVVLEDVAFMTDRAYANWRQCIIVKKV